MANSGKIPNAISVYDNYCSGVGYPRNAVATQTPSSCKHDPIQTFPLRGVSNDENTAPNTQPTQSASPTPGNSVSTSSSPGNTGSSTSSSNGNSNPSNSSSGSGSGSSSKIQIGPIIGGVVGGLGGAALLLGGIIFYLHSQRKYTRQGQNQGYSPEAGAPRPPPFDQPEKQVPPAVARKKLPVEERPISPVSPILSPVEPVALVRKPVGGRAELMEKENEPVVEVTPASAPNGTELQGEGRYGLRHEELDADGRYVGELHGDGRQFTGSELP